MSLDGHDNVIVVQLHCITGFYDVFLEVRTEQHISI